MYTIRQFQPKDTFVVIKIASMTLTEKYNSSLFNYFYETFPQGFLVAEQDHKIIGFTVGVKINQQKAKILMLSVLEKHRRQKIGTALLNQLIKTIKEEKIPEIDLEVRTDNIKAIKFYKKNNFIVTDKQIQFYQDGKNAYTMSKQIL